MCNHSFALASLSVNEVTFQDRAHISFRHMTPFLLHLSNSRTSGNLFFFILPSFWIVLHRRLSHQSLLVKSQLFLSQDPSSVNGSWWLFLCFAGVYPQDAQCFNGNNVENEVWHIALFPKSRGIHKLTWAFIIQSVTEIMFDINLRTETGKHNSFHPFWKHN